MIAYRPDIDGLRAIAVLLVVIYHAVPTAMPGGYIGVDVFFVISGYLITKLIVKDIERRQFSVVRFYVRRTKRILPALFVVLFSVLALGCFLLTPTELKALGRTMAATAAFVSNHVFWQDTGYFDAAAESKPLLHTWSLAVEEQFYVVWPLTLLLIYRRRYAHELIAVIIAVSFLASCYLVVRHQPTAFFLLPPRSWELLLGAAIALGMTPPLSSSRHRDLAAMLGIALIVVAAFMLDRSSPFPGWNALAPCIGAGLIIIAGDGGGNVAARHFLTKRPVVFIGLISYSLYLWHWPLLSLARIVGRGELALTPSLAVVGLAFILSALTWRFVETPLRAGGATPRPAPVLAVYGTISVIAIAVGYHVYSADGFLSRAGEDLRRAEAARYDVNPSSALCLRWQSARGPLPVQECITGGDLTQRRLVLWGDSHADAVAPGVIEFARANGYVTHQLTMAGCPPLVGARVVGTGADYSPCAEFNRRVLDYIRSEPLVEVVMLSSRWPLYTENERFGNDPGPISYLVDESDDARSPEASKRVFVRALGRTTAIVRELGPVVLVLGTIPSLGINVPECVARNHMPLSGVRDCNVESGAVLRNLAYADQQIESMADAAAGVCAHSPAQTLCRQGRCMAISGNDILYANDDHLSVQGALLVARDFQFESCLTAEEP